MDTGEVPVFIKNKEAQMSDKLNDVMRKVIEFRDARDWEQFHDPKNLAEALSIESGELLEKFLWMPSEKSYDLSGKKLAETEEEVADIMIFLIYLCHALKIDLIRAVENKIEVNNKKYPVEKAKGNSKKYKEFK